MIEYLDGKEYRRLDSIIRQLDLTDIYRILHPTMVEYAFFFKFTLNIHRMVPMLGCKLNVSKLKGVKIIQSMFLTTMELN